MRVPEVTYALSLCVYLHFLRLENFGRPDHRQRHVLCVQAGTRARTSGSGKLSRYVYLRTPFLPFLQPSVRVTGVRRRRVDEMS